MPPPPCFGMYGYGPQGFSPVGGGGYGPPRLPSGGPRPPPPPPHMNGNDDNDDDGDADVMDYQHGAMPPTRFGGSPRCQGPPKFGNNNR